MSATVSESSGPALRSDTLGSFEITYRMYRHQTVAIVHWQRECWDLA